MRKSYEDYITKTTEKGAEEIAKPAVKKKFVESYNNIASTYLKTDKVIAKEYVAKSLEIDPADKRALELQAFLKEKGVPSMIYYPIPLYDQEVFAGYHNGVRHIHTEQLCQEVISFPIHTEMEIETQTFIIATIKSFFTS